MRFIGLDLTDPYAARPRAIDVAIVDESGACELALLPGAITGISAARVLETLAARAGDVLVIDGPLALAASGASSRECERLLRAPGKTPGTLPVPGSRPFAGFVRGSVELASLLAADGWVPLAEDTQATSATMLEAYPGASWPALAGARLPRKATAEGVRARDALLRQHGLRFREPPSTHDQLDAALCAWLGWTLHRDPARLSFVGRRTFSHDGHWREGSILQIR